MKRSVGDLVKWDGVNSRGHITRRTGVIVSVVPRKEVPKAPELFPDAKAVYGNEVRALESYLVLSEDHEGRQYLYWPRSNTLASLEQDRGKYVKVINVLKENALC